MTALLPGPRPTRRPARTPAARTCVMHRIHASTVVALLLGVILTLVVALQMLPSAGTPDASAPVRAGLESVALADAATLPLPLFFAWAVLAILLTAAVLLSATKRSGRS